MSEARSMAVDGLYAALKALPKVDLHRHLEGSLRVETLSEIARGHGLGLPAEDPLQLRPLVTVGSREPDFAHFLEVFGLLRRFHLSREAIERFAYEAVADAAADNVRYLELRFNPVALAQARRFPLDEVTSWVCEAVARAGRECGVGTGLIVQVGRAEAQRAREVVEVALAHRQQGVVGLDLAGDELRYPAGDFVPFFRRAWEGGLHITVHAGEVGGADNICEAVERLMAQRIGHGVRVVGDARAMALARERNVAFEVCPISNLCTGVTGRAQTHPLPRMLEAGLCVTVNTDDPGITGTTLTDEYYTVVTEMGVPLEHLSRMIVAAAESTFQPATVRATLVHSLRAELLQAEMQLRCDSDDSRTR